MSVRVCRVKFPETEDQLISRTAYATGYNRPYELSSHITHENINVGSYVSDQNMVRIFVATNESPSPPRRACPVGFERSLNKFGIDRKATKLVGRIFSSAFLAQSLNGFKSTFHNTRAFAA